MLDVLEEETHRYTSVLLDDTGAVIPASQVNEYRLILRNLVDARILNNRDGTVAPAPNVSIAQDGTLTWASQPDDNIVVDPVLTYETHVALFQFVYAGTKIGRLAVLVRVRNLGIGAVPPPPPPAPGAPVWTFYQPLAGARPGRTFTAPKVPVGIQVFYNTGQLNLVNPPGIGEFTFASAIVTTGFDVQPTDALWAHIYG